MASFTDAINALVAERDRQFVIRICSEYNLNFEELNAKYLETAAAAIKVPRKYKKRDPKTVTVVEVKEGETPAPKPAKTPKEKQCCTAHTSKKEPCKFSALKGEVFCLRHLKASQAAPADPKAPKPVKAKKEAKPEQPVHNHALTEEVQKDCELCQSHGNPLAESQDFEVVPVPVTVTDRLASILAEADEESDSEELAIEADSEEECATGGAESEYEDE